MFDLALSITEFCEYRIAKHSNESPLSLTKRYALIIARSHVSMMMIVQA